MLPQLAAWLIAAAPLIEARVGKRTALTDCLTSANVPQALPGSSTFAQEAKPFNLRVPFTPAAIAMPTAVEHVQAAVSCAVKNNVKVSAKSGGHSYGSLGLGGEDGHLVVDFHNMYNVTVDSSTQIATIQAGARLGNVAQALYSQGQRAMSHGTCPGVGIGGLSLHGGYGYSSRNHGLTLDNLVEATVVLANSSVVTASARSNKDLFWALRGAGAYYGIVTQFKFNTFAAPNANIVFSYNLNYASGSAAATAFSALQDFSINGQPAELNMRIMINGGGCQLIGVYYGNRNDFDSIMAPILSKIGNPSGQNQTMDWLSTLKNYAYMDLTQPLNYDLHETFFCKSMMTTLTSAGMLAFSNYWFSTAKSINRAWYAIMDFHGGNSSAISKVGTKDTAYAHRAAALKFELYDRAYTGSYPSDGYSFLNGWVSAVQQAMPSTTIGMYINYADTSLTADQAHKYYWLDNYAELVRIKAIYDPNKVIMSPQGISS